jgi:hypothetical protein
LRGDLHGPVHVGSAGFGELGRFGGKKILEAGRGYVYEQLAGLAADVFEGMHALARNYGGKMGWQDNSKISAGGNPAKW